MKTVITLALTLSLTSAFANTRHDKVTNGSAATTGSASGGTFASEAPPVNDTVQSGQASTMRERKDNKAITCVDRDGRAFAKNEVGYSSCRSQLRAR